MIGLGYSLLLSVFSFYLHGFSLVDGSQILNYLMPNKNMLWPLSDVLQD